MYVLCFSFLIYDIFALLHYVLRLSESGRSALVTPAIEMDTWLFPELVKKKSPRHDARHISF